jgi:2-polyprenyl-6-methoxyphenol hydroxylase-like FAD-dependent oxidoreductase
VQAVPGGYRVGGHHADGTPFAVTARFVAGADGAHSTIRSAMGLDFPGETYQQQFLLADIALTGQPCADNEAVICTSPRGVVVVGRMPNGTYRIVATMPPGARVPQHPDRAQIGRLLTERGIDAEPAADPVWASRFRVHHRAAARFRRGGLLLCGDAAHIHSPAAGQGMNTGMADAYDLAGRLAAVTSGAADPRCWTATTGNAAPPPPPCWPSPTA